MKIDPNQLIHPHRKIVKLWQQFPARSRRSFSTGFRCVMWTMIVSSTFTNNAFSQFASAPQTRVASVAGPADSAPTSTPDPTRMSQRGREVVRAVIRRLTLGPAFDAKIRKRVWVSGREVAGVGIYEQAGMSTGRYNLQVTMHDGEGQHSLQQISDGRLAWTRTVIADQVTLKRVDVRILEQRLRDATSQFELSPHLLVGGIVEQLDSIARDYDLSLKSGRFKLKSGTSSSETESEQTFLVVSGSIKDSVRENILRTSGRPDWPALYPSQVRLLITTQPNQETGFGEGLPARIDFFGDPQPITPDSKQSLSPTTPGPPISLMDIYSVQPITTPSVERFSFESRDADNHYANETERYLKRFGL